MFENLTMGAVYELGRRRLAGDARWRRLLPGLQDFLRHSGVRRLQSVHSYGNHQLVEAVEVEFLLRSALRSNRAVDILGPRRAYFSGLARGLILEPKLMLIDEPSIGLAPIMVDEVFAILASLRARGMTVLMIEQNAKRALELSDDGIVLELGRTRMADRAARILADPRIGQLFLGGGLTAGY